jgi:(p)ppGpp synthase/HD superfamily hydrolase
MQSVNGKIKDTGSAAAAVEPLIERVSRYLPEDKTALVRRAYEFADLCHHGQTRMSGGPYIAHPLEAAIYLADLNLDADTIIAALLHDVMEDCNVTFQEISSLFNPAVAKLVDGVTKLTRMNYQPPGSTAIGTDSTTETINLYAESLRKMLVAMAEDIRVVLIKLADRLHNMRILDALFLEKRQRIV